MHEAEDNIFLIGDHTDELHNAYECSLEDEKHEYNSVIHYCYCRIMYHLNLAHETNKILEAKSIDVAGVARQIIRDHLPQGFPFESLNDYLTACKDAFMREGLQLRFQSDETFQKTLMSTGQSLLVVCDPRDTDFGIGMDRDTFNGWTKEGKIRPDTLYHWMLRPGSCPHLCIGKNKLGLLLMWLRSEALKNQILQIRTQMTYTVEGLTVSDQIIALTGVFRPLSNVYALPILINGKRYRSVEHFVYNKLFRAMNLNEKALEKIRTTADPSKVYKVATGVLETSEEIEIQLFHKYWSRMTKWYHRAIRVKLAQYPILKRLLLSTGDSIIIDTNCQEDKEWSMGTSEQEIQHLMTKRYFSPSDLLSWMLLLRHPPTTLSHLGLNKTGLFLMELRHHMVSTNDQLTNDPLPLIAPPSDITLRSRVSAHMICFTAESIFHPLYPSVVKDDDDTAYPTAQHYICYEAAKYFDLPQSSLTSVADADYPGNEVSVIFGQEFASRFPPVEQLYAWEYRDTLEIVKKALKLRFEQNQMFLRALLDTGDALLVFCQRFLTNQCEWSIGMKEKELRNWMDIYGLNTNQLVELCVIPQSQRPCFLGGNRLGLLLMELRREFVLDGVFPSNLPELGISPDGILGSDSATENIDLYEYFDLLDEHNYLAVWPNPYILAAKCSDDDELYETATRRFVPEHVRAANDAKSVSRIESVLQSTTLNTSILDEMDENVQRQLVLAMVSKVRTVLVTSQLQQNEIRFLNREIERVGDLRKTMEALVLHDQKGDEKKENALKSQSPVPPIVYGSKSSLPVEKFSHEDDYGVKIEKLPKASCVKSEPSFPSTKSYEVMAQSQIITNIKIENGEKESEEESEEEEGEIFSD